MRVFWPVTCESHSSAISGLQKETKNCYVFHFRLLPAKSKTSWKLKNTPFWALFAHFRTKATFSEKSTYVTFFISRFLLLCRIWKNNNEQIPRKVGYRRIDGPTHGRWIHSTSDWKIFGTIFLITVSISLLKSKI